MTIAPQHLRTAIILAGGLGTRLRREVADVPKPMAPVGGRPFLEHQIEYWIGQGISRFILSVGYKRDVIMEHFGSTWSGAAIDYAVEEEPLGTGGGVLLACSHLPSEEPFVLLNGDTFFAVRLNELLAYHQAQTAALTAALFEAPVSDRYGRADLSADGRLRFLAAEPARVGELANGGLYLLTRNTLAAWMSLTPCKISFETEILPGLLNADQRLFGFKSKAAFVDIGIPDDWRRAMDVIASAQG